MKIIKKIVISLLIATILYWLIIPPKALSDSSKGLAEPVVMNTRELSIKGYAKYHTDLTFGPNHWEAFDKIITKESNWKHTAQNPNSSAYGLAQTMMSLYVNDLTADFKDDPYDQIDWAIKYIEDRYSNPNIALEHHLQNNWY